MTKEERLELLQKQKELDLNRSILFCLGKDEVKPFIKFLLDSTMAMDSVPAGLTHDSTIELASLHRVGNKLLKVLMEASPELTGQLLVSLKKDEQNEKALFANE